MRARIDLSTGSGRQSYEVDVDPESTIARVIDHGALHVVTADDMQSIIAAGEWQRVDIVRLDPLPEPEPDLCICPRRMVGGQVTQVHLPRCPRR